MAMVSIQNQYVIRTIPAFPLTTIATSNQPSTASAGKRISVISNNAADTQKIIIWGYQTGALTTLVSEVITLNGTSGVNSVATNWETIVGAFLGDKFGNISTIATGTILIRNQDNATIYTLAAATYSIGAAYFQIDGYNTQVYNLSGNIWYNTIPVYNSSNVLQATSTTSWKFEAGATDLIKVATYISLVSDGTGASCQIRLFHIY